MAVCLSLGKILCREIIKIRSLKTLNVWAHSSKKYIYIKSRGWGGVGMEKKKKKKTTLAVTQRSRAAETSLSDFWGFSVGK